MYRARYSAAGASLTIALLLSLMLASLASAHHTGSVTLPCGECLNVGSLKVALDLEAGNPHPTADG